MADRLDAAAARVPAGGDSQASAPKPRRQRETGAAPDCEQNQLDLCAAVPLHVKPVLNGYAEVAAVGICSERALRRHLATGRVRRCVIRNGRNLRFVKDILIAELLEAEG